ncbi:MULTISPECIES: EAL domain-containing protein [unclassified Sphingomonas]|uniref:sensor domain-containing protein n=1 Tax=unclassified Sphingomonas TaxID=196159 RepID=UPI00226A77B7|nr:MULTISPECIES: EAL domain-containing protein [unclassified Sphingomonas]
MDQVEGRSFVDSGDDGGEISATLADIYDTLARHPALAAAGADQPSTPWGSTGDLGSADLDRALSRVRIGILHRDSARRVLAVNERFCELIGRSVDELAGVSLEAYIHPDDAAAANAEYNHHTATATPYDRDLRFVRRDGSVVWCVISISYVCDAAGQAISTITVLRDITSRRTAEEGLRESERHYRYSVDLSPTINWIGSAEGAIEEVSSRWEDVTGGAPADALGERWVEALHPDDVAPTMAAWAEALASCRPVDIEYRLRTRDGSYRWFRSRAAARLDGEGRAVRWYGTLEDIDDRKLAENALRESEERFRLAAHAAGLGIWDYDAVHDRREWSDELKRMMGVPLDARPDVATALALVVPEDRHALESLVAAVAAGDGGHRFEVTLRIHRADDGALRWMQTGGWRIEGAAGQLGRVLVTVRDVTEERTAEQRIRWAASHDAMTRLPNRAAFGERLERGIAQAERDGSRLALVLFDVDHLKETNDTIGHDAGDLLLRTFAERLREALGPDCAVARLGGDEFAAVLTDVDGEATVSELVLRVLRVLREPFTHEGRILDCQATAGGSIFPVNGRDAAELLKAADMALYAAKGRQRGGLLMFRADMRADVQRRSSMISIARDAAHDDRITPFYQPKVQLLSGRVSGFEALLRWRDRQGSLHLPGTIAAAFEDLDLAVALSERMLERIVVDMRDWLDRGIDFGRVAVNLSPAEFRHESLADRIMERLHGAGVPPSRLELEVTETVFLGRDAECVGQTLDAFSRAGVTIALDDFGTGYASLTHLKAFPVDVIKIDRSFVSSLDTDAGDAAIIDAVVGLGHRLGMKVVAEGVETLAQARHLREGGCDEGQGYLFGRAVPAAVVPGLIVGEQWKAVG